MQKSFSHHHILADLLIDLQVAMQECGVWQCDRPSEQALKSTQPFCIDTMSFEQWLRFVMIERFKVLLANGSPLPTSCNVSPMAEEAFKDKSEQALQNMVECLNRIDQHLSTSM